MQLLVSLVWNRQERRLRALWRLMLHSMLTTLVVGGCMTGLFVGVLLGFDSNSFLFEIVAAIAQSTGLILGSLVAYLWIDRRTWAATPTATVLRQLGFGLLLGAALMSGIVITGYFFDSVVLEVAPEVNHLPRCGTLLLSQLAWLAAMAFVGVGEELFSRGLQMKNLAEGFSFLGVRTSTFLGMSLSSAFFGVFHLANPHASVFSTLAITAAGLMLALARWAGGSLAFPIGIHITWNYFQGPVFGFAVSGTAIEASVFHVSRSEPAWLTGGDFGPEAGLLGILALAIGAIIIVDGRYGSAKSRRRRLAENMLRIARFSNRH